MKIEGFFGFPENSTVNNGLELTNNLENCISALTELELCIN